MRLNDLLRLGLPMLEGEGGGGGGNTEKTAEELAAEEEEREIQERKDLSESGKAVLREERRLKKAAEKQAADLKVERDALLQKEQEREAEAKKRQEAEAAEAGKFQELAEKREQERDTAIQERDALKAENQKLTDTLKAGVDGQWKELPEEVRKVGEKSHPEDDILGRYAFLTDPDTKALVVKIAGTGNRREGNGPNPPPKVGEKTGDDAAVMARNARRYG